MKKLIIMGAFAVVSLGQAYAAGPAPTPSPSPIGEWLVQDETAHIRIHQCGTSLWGVISWAKEAGKDEHNPDPAKRNRPVLGIPILMDMKSTKPNRWDGEVYDADDGRIYTSHISLSSADVLRIDGCVMGGLICGGEDWKRLPTPKTDLPADICTKMTK